MYYKNNLLFVSMYPRIDVIFLPCFRKSFNEYRWYNQS